jgi:cytochrome c oxidase cbb3-type subunit II
MAYRMVPRVPMLAVADQSGILWQHYNGPAGASSNSRIRGPYIEWLNPVQRQHFLRLGLVEEIDAALTPTPLPAPIDPEPEPIDLDADTDDTPDAVGADTHRVAECMAALDRLGVPRDAGAPKARSAVREAGEKFGNDVVAAAVRQRKFSLSRTAEDDEEESFEVVQFQNVRVDLGGRHG